MRIPGRDVLATVFVAAVVMVSVLWLAGAAFADLSARRVGFVVLWLGLGGCAAAQPRMAEVYGGRARRPYAAAVTVSGVAALAAGVAVLASPGAPALAGFTVATVTLWALATVRHLRHPGGGDEAPATEPEEDQASMLDMSP